MKMIGNLETAIYIDYDNLYRSMNESYSTFTGPETVKEIVKYMVEKENCNIKLVKAFCDFKNSYQEIDELQQNLVELRHINSVGNGKSNASDIGLAIDVVKSLFNSKKFDTYVIVSSDSDMLPLILELSYQGKEVILVYLESKISDKYTEVLIQKPNIKTVKIEDVLGIPVHSPISKERLEADSALVSRYVNSTNDIMNDLFGRYGEATTVSQNAIKGGLKEKNTDVEDLDATVILDFMKGKEYVRQIEKEVVIKGKAEKQKRNSCVLDIEKLNADGISLSNEAKLVYLDPLVSVK